MARVVIESDSGRDRIFVRQDTESGDTAGWCEKHHEWVTDRGQFEDTCQAIAVHLDRKHS